ncbi:MAG: NADH-quinone oxidoreductase subunit N [Pseudomonadales bacterium]|nr:NADH-quinone oxidoreductase subunit N [Pseudomonadales bacterium]
MDMTSEHIVALLPIILITATSVIVMLLAAFLRNHKLVASVTVIGLLAALWSLSLQLNAPPLQITPLLLVDPYSVFYAAIMIVTVIAVTILSYGYFVLREGLQEELYILLLTSTLGAIVLVFSSHFAAFFLGLELMSISLFALVAYPVTTLTRQGEPLEASLKYLVLSGVSSAFLAFGMCLIYAATGTMFFPELAIALSNLDHNYYAIAGTAMVVAGTGFKLSVVPFHMWTPDIYQGAPAPVSSFVATVSKGAVLITLLKIFILLDVYQYESIIMALTLIAGASMIIGNLLALLQTNVKRLLAYSSTAHMGYALVAFLAAKSLVAGDSLAVEAVGYYMVAYIITTLTAFGIISVLSSDQEHIDQNRDFELLEDFRGLFWKHPYIASVFIASLLSLAGIPLTVGFIGKFYIVATGVQSEMWPLILALVIGSSIGLYYYLRLVFIMFLKQEESEDEGFASAAQANLSVQSSDIALPVGGQIVVAILALLILCLGVYPTPLIEAIQIYSSGIG